MTGREWVADASCAGHPELPPETWDSFIEGEGTRSSARSDRLAAALEVCLDCPVWEQCRAEGASGFGGGVRAGGLLADTSPSWLDGESRDHRPSLAAPELRTDYDLPHLRDAEP